MSATLKEVPVTGHAEPAAAPTLDPGMLAAVIDETARRVEARAARPSPIHLRTWEEIERFAEKAARSGMVPKDFVGKPDAICIAVQLGGELGLAPMQSLQNIAVVNGRPTIWGDALPALCRASGMCKSIREWNDGEGDGLTYYCEAVRRDQASSPILAKFSVADAKRAKLWQENPTVKRKGRDGGTYEADSGPWYSYPERMLRMRARGFALRDAFPDVLKGLLSAEEAADIPFDATGLTAAPSPAPIRAAPAPTPKAPRKTETEKAAPTARTDEQWRVWVDKLQAACSVLYRRSEVVEIAERPSVSDAIATGPAWVQREVSAILAENYRRFPEDPDAETPDDLHIEGEHLLAAG